MLPLGGVSLIECVRLLVCSIQTVFKGVLCTETPSSLLTISPEDFFSATKPYHGALGIKESHSFYAFSIHKIICGTSLGVAWS